MLSDKNSIFYSNSFMDYIGDFLDKEGGIPLVSIDKLVEIMKESQDKLVPKCMAITIISLSKTEVQIKLCESGVWNILFQWLQDGLKNDTTCFILEILRLYLSLPITFENLTSNSCPKLIKKLTKNGNPDVISISKNIVAKWKKVVEERTAKEALEVPTKKFKLDDNAVTNNSNNNNSINKTVIKTQEEKKKIRTVKVRNTNFRNMADEEPEIDTSKLAKKLIKKPEDNKPGMEELHQKVSANVDKRKVLEIHESKNFINSIMQTPAPPRKKKKRLDASINKSASDVSMTEEVMPSDTNTKVSPSPQPEASALPLEKQKKRVSWAPTDSLQSIKYFDLDENERVNVLKVSMEELKKKERMIERQNLSHKYSSDDVDDDNQSEKWYKPLTVVGSPRNKIEIVSLEKTIQFERERKVLKVLYFQKDSIPLSATEPENEPYDVKEPLIIPLEDITSLKSAAAATVKNTAANSNDVNSKLLIYTEKEGGSECHVTLRPDVANLLKSMTQNNNNTQEQSSALPPSAASSSDFNNPDAPQTRTKLINIIRSRYPDIDPEKLTSEEVCRLLEPLRDQLIREGILSMPPVAVPMPAVSQNLSVPPPNFGGGAVPLPPPWFTAAAQDQRSSAHYPPPQQQQQMMVHRMPFMPPCVPQNVPFINNNNNQQQQHNQQRHMRPVCRFLANNGFCRLGNNCGFSHMLPDGPRQFNHNSRH